MQCNIRIFLRGVDEKYYIELMNAKRLKRICALSQIHLYSEQGNNKTDYYIKCSELSKFLRVMRLHKIHVLFC